MGFNHNGDKMNLIDLLQHKIFITIVSGFVTVLIILFKYFKSSIEKKVEDFRKELIIQQKDINKIDRRLLEYQISANSTFVMKEDLKDFKDEIRSRE